MKKIKVLKNFKASNDGYNVIEYLKNNDYEISDDLYNSLKDVGCFSLAEEAEVTEKKVVSDNFYEKKVVSHNNRIKKNKKK